jgi:hypothetical protein
MHAADVILGDDGQSGGWVRRLELQPPVCPVSVVVLDVDPEDLLQGAWPNDQQPVQALRADRADPPLRLGVRVRRLHRGHQHLHTLGPKHVIEPAAELRVSIANEEAHPASAFVQGQQQVRACWVIQAALGLAVTPARWTRRVSSSMKNSTYSRRSQMVSTVKRSPAMISVVCWRRNACQVVVARRSAGSSPWRRSVVRIAVAETRTPRRTSSPWMRW